MLKHLICRFFHLPWEESWTFEDSVSGGTVHRYVCPRCNEAFCSHSLKFWQFRSYSGTEIGYVPEEERLSGVEYAQGEHHDS